jgi:signal transduction histidine kinase
MLAPLLLGALVFYFLREPLTYWRDGEKMYDEQAMQEWVREARIGSNSLPALLKDLLKQSADCTTRLQAAQGILLDSILKEHTDKRAEIKEMLQGLGQPTKIYPGQLPLFPVVYRLEVRFDDELKDKYDPRLSFAPIVWESENPRHRNQFRELEAYQLFRDEGIKVHVQFQLHAYAQKQYKEREDDARRRLVNIWVLFFAFVALLWMLILHLRETNRERQRQQTDQQIQESRQKHLEEELRRQEAERKQEEAERRQLQEELRRQAAEREKQEAERQALELKSQMFHSIGIMAKSYAHNIKNLLVRPNDLLRRCMEERPSDEDKARMLHEIQQTLGTVTERLQEILQTVQRDPNKFERVQIDLNALAKDLYATWGEQAESKWKMMIELDLHRSPHAPREDFVTRSVTTTIDQPVPLLVSGDRSHLQQTLENFLFNARDAISEMRNHLRKQARPEGAASKGPLDEAQRQALIAAAGWKGRVLIKTTIIGGQPVIEVHDNGIGMTPDTRDHCTEANFSTKRNNALYAGLSAGMGLGLSFVQMILEHHGAKLEIESEPLKGAVFRVRFPASETSGGTEAVSSHRSHDTHPK